MTSENSGEWLTYAEADDLNPLVYVYDRGPE